MAVNWGLLQQGQDPGQRFQQAYDAGIQRQDQQALRGFQQEQMQDRRTTRAASVAAGTRIAAGDYAGAITAAAPSGDLDLIRAISTMSQEQRAQARARNQAITPLRMQARQLPVEQRRAFIASVAPRLQSEFGMTPEQIAAYDPSDQQLDADIALGMTMEQALAQGSLDWHGVAGGPMFATDSRGRPIPSTDPRLRANMSPGAPAAQPAPAGAAPPANIPSGSPLSPAPTAGNGQSYRDPVYDQLEAQIGPEIGVPPAVLAAVRTRGERSNANQVSPAGARSVYQFTPETRQLFMNRYGVDAWADPQSAARAAALHLRESYDRTGSWNRAVVEYHGGPDSRQHGPITRAYAQRVGSMDGQQTAQAGPVPTPGQPQSIQDQAMTGYIQPPRAIPPQFEAAPGGAIRPMRGSQAEYDREQGARNNQRQDTQVVNQVRQEFNQLPEVRDFTTMRSAMLQIRRLAESVPQDSPERAQADMGLIFSFMKALDPTSAVRETEYANAQNSAGVPDRVRNFYNRTLTGASLNPNQRRGMVNAAYEAYLARAEVYNGRARQYHQYFRDLGVPEPATYAPLATGPETEARQRQPQQGQRSVPIRIISRRPVEAPAPNFSGAGPAR